MYGSLLATPVPPMSTEADTSQVESRGAGHMISLTARHRAMRAADLVDTRSIREAAVLGGIVRRIIASGRCDVDHVAHDAHAIICAFNLVGVDRSTPCPTEWA